MDTRSRAKPSENTSKSGVNPSRGLKRPPVGLDEWIGLANLVRPGMALPEDLFEPEHRQLISAAWAVAVERIAGLEDPLKSELLAYFAPESQRAKDWLQKHEVWLRENRIDVADYMIGLRYEETMWFYDRIRTAYTQLRILAREPSESEHDSLSSLESLVSILRYADLRYLRTCGYCNNIFYASKSGKSAPPGCTPRHSANLRNRTRRKKLEELEEQKKRRQKREKLTRKNLREREENRRRLKRAKTAPKR